MRGVVKFNHIANESVQNTLVSKILRKLAEMSEEIDKVMN